MGKAHAQPTHAAVTSNIQNPYIVHNLQEDGQGRDREKKRRERSGEYVRHTHTQSIHASRHSQACKHGEALHFDSPRIKTRRQRNHKSYARVQTRARNSASTTPTHTQRPTDTQAPRHHPSSAHLQPLPAIRVHAPAPVHKRLRWLPILHFAAPGRTPMLHLSAERPH